MVGYKPTLAQRNEERATYYKYWSKLLSVEPSILAPYTKNLSIRTEKFYLKKCKWDKINLILKNIKPKKDYFDWKWHCFPPYINTTMQWTGLAQLLLYVSTV